MPGRGGMRPGKDVICVLAFVKLILKGSGLVLAGRHVYWLHLYLSFNKLLITFLLDLQPSKPVHVVAFPMEFKTGVVGVFETRYFYACECNLMKDNIGLLRGFDSRQYTYEGEFQCSLVTDSCFLVRKGRRNCPSSSTERMASGYSSVQDLITA